MFERMPTIEGLMNEHSAIRGQMELVRDLIREWDQLLNPQENTLKSAEKLSVVTAKRRSLVQAIGYLEDGLKNHHSHEERVMPPLVGDLLWKAIRLEHDEMLESVDVIDSLLVNTSIESFIDKGCQIVQSIDDLVRVISSHSIREDEILYFLKKLPELRGQ
jgi:hypothetical protein